MSFMIETSARHIHLTQETVEKLFGKGYELTIRKPLSYPGQYACNERLTIVGPKKEMANVSILGPTRKADQVEVSATDARTLGIDAPIRESGDVKGSGACKLIGPAGEVELSEGVIVAKRHLHVTEEDAAAMGIKNGEIIKVACGGEGRKLIFDDVVVRVNVGGATTMHIDTDESQAANGPTVGALLPHRQQLHVSADCLEFPRGVLHRSEGHVAAELAAGGLKFYRQGRGQRAEIAQLHDDAPAAGFCFQLCRHDVQRQVNAAADAVRLQLLGADASADASAGGGQGYLPGVGRIDTDRAADRGHIQLTQ